jgi:hypothetical protein
MDALNSDRSVSISALFNHFFTVAEFQREYVWTDDDVSKLLQGIWDTFEKNPNQQYFIGSIVLSSAGGDNFLIVDGQQRLTTLFLALCGLKHTFQTIDPSGKNEIAFIEGKLRALGLGPQGTPTENYRIVLGSDVSQNIIEAAYGTGAISIETKDDSSLHLREAYDTCVSFYNSSISSKNRANEYLKYFMEQVRLLPYVASSLKHALIVFETLNSRGVGLTPIDLVKNILFKHTSQDAWDSLQERWKEFINVLEIIKEQPQRFLKYFILTSYGAVCAESEVFDWINDNSNLTHADQDPFGFLDTLMSFAESYRFIIDGKAPDGSSNPYVSNIRKLTGRARQHFPFLISVKHFPKENADRFILATESLLMAFGVQRMYTGEIEKTFSTWTQSARKCESTTDIEAFYQEKVAPEMKRVGALALEKLTTLDEKLLTKQKMVYFLCRLDSYLQTASEPGSFYRDIASGYKGFDIEHILSQSPKDYKKLGYPTIEEYEQYVSRLGNLTVLEKTLNRAIKDKEFSEKREVGYKNSAYLLTKGIAVKLPGKSKFAKALNNVSTFESWNKADIEQRQKNLINLAAEAFQWK